MTVPGGATPRRLKVVVIDDSTVARRVIQHGLETNLPIDVVGSEGDALAGIRSIEQNGPDAVVMDLEMPGMDGIEAIAQIRRRWPGVSSVVFTGSSRPASALDAGALAAGAVVVVRKPPPMPSPDHAAHYVQVHLGAPLMRVQRALPRSAPATDRAVSLRPTGFAAMVLGASTGGPDAVEAVLRELPKDFRVPLLIVQHIGESIGSSLLARFAAACALPVLEGVDGVPVVAGRVYLAAAGRHMEVRRGRGGVHIHTHTSPPEHYVRPAVDVLFRSAATVWGRNTLGVVLTGMGEDGAAGCRLIRSVGGAVIAQDQASSVVWGMPGAVAKAGLTDCVLPLTSIGAALVQNAPLSSEPCHDHR